MGKRGIKGWTINITPRRKTELTDKKLGVILNGEDNNYPTRMENTVNNSITSKMCANMYARFLGGNGFVDESLNDVVVGEDYTTGKKVTALKMLNSIAREFSRHCGTWINCGYNGELKIDSLELMPTKYCRFGKRDDKKYSGKILVSDKWGEMDRKSEDSIKVYNTFSTDEKIIRYQIAGKNEAKDVEVLKGIRDWKGQIYMQFLDDEYIYPLSLIDPAQHDADTEFQISLFKNGELRRGFFAKYIIAYDEIENDNDAEEFLADLRSLEGAAESGSVMLVEGAERDMNNELIMPFAIQKIEQNINDKLFESYEKSTSNNIRKAFQNIPPVLVDYQEGKLGNTSGESIREAIDFYNDQTRSQRKVIENIFIEIMKNWYQEDLNSRNWEIKEIDDFNNVQSTADDKTDIGE